MLRWSVQGKHFRYLLFHIEWGRIDKRADWVDGWSYTSDIQIAG